MAPGEQGGEMVPRVESTGADDASVVGGGRDGVGESCDADPAVAVVGASGRDAPGVGANGDLALLSEILLGAVPGFLRQTQMRSIS